MTEAINLFNDNTKYVVFYLPSHRITTGDLSPPTTTPPSCAVSVHIINWDKNRCPVKDKQRECVNIVLIIG